MPATLAPSHVACAAKRHELCDSLQKSRSPEDPLERHICIISERCGGGGDKQGGLLLLAGHSF